MAGMKKNKRGWMGIDETGGCSKEKGCRAPGWFVSWGGEGWDGMAL